MNRKATRSARPVKTLPNHSKLHQTLNTGLLLNELEASYLPLEETTMKLPSAIGLFAIILVVLPSISSSEDRWWELQMNDKRFGYENFMKIANRIEKHLDGFRDFSNLILSKSDLNQHIFRFNEIHPEQDVSIKLKGKDLHRFQSSLLWEQQNIGFPNSLVAIKGYGLISQSKILELRIENLKLKGATQGEIDDVQASLEAVRAELQAFLSEQKWTD